MRNRWYKIITLINNPSLVFERLMKLYQQEVDSAGSDEGERSNLKVISYYLCVVRLKYQPTFVSLHLECHLIQLV